MRWNLHTCIRAIPVGVIVPTVGLHLDVLADHVHADALHGFNVKFQGIICGCCVDAIGMIPLKFTKTDYLIQNPKYSLLVPKALVAGRVHRLRHAAIESVLNLSGWRT